MSSATSQIAGNGYSHHALCLVGGSVLRRAAYRSLLREALHVDVAVECDFRPTSVWEAMRIRPDVAIVEADNPRPEVLDAVEMMVRLNPELRVLVVSAAVEPEQVEPWAPAVWPAMS